MKRVALLAILVVFVLLAGQVLAAGNANFILGQRSLRDDPWDSIDQDQQGVFGVNVDFGAKTWPIRLAAGMNASADSTTVDGFFESETISSAVVDVSFGVVWYPIQDRSIRPYVGGGASSVGIGIDDEFETETDQSFGFYVNGGVFWRLGKRFNIGFDLRVLRGTDFTVFDEKFDADYEQLGLILGFGW